MKQFILVALALCLAACGPQESVNVVLPDGFNVQARIADTPQSREKGLMFVKNLPENEGMLFVFEQEDDLAFWMKNTLIDLDIVFIGADHTVTTVAEQVPHSYTYTPDTDVAHALGYGQYVLELSAQTARRHGVKPGTKIQFSLTDKK